MGSSPGGHWPGKRTKPLHEIDLELHITLFLKVLSCYYDLKHANVEWTQCNAFFQKIEKYDDDEQNVGWIHKDDGDELAGLIYLTPNANPNTGTSLFSVKPEAADKHVEFTNNPEKMAFYDGNRILKEDYLRALNEHNDMFYETIKFQNVYNRLITYSSDEYHRANSFNAGDEERLTLVFFMRGIKQGHEGMRIGRYPSTRVKDNFNFDSKFETRIRYVQANR
jgi:hypothetical protein